MRKDPEYLSPYQLQQLIAAMPTPMLREAVIVMYSYALRISELCSLEKGNVNWNLDIVRITGKGKTRDLPITEATRQILQGAMKRPGKLFNINIRTMRNYIYNSSLRAGMERINPHMVRHSRATHLMNEGYNLADIKAVMRHESTASTIIYTHVAIDRLRKVMN